MKILLLALVAFLPSFANALDLSKCPINLVPNQSIGPLKLGMTRKDLDAQKIGTHDVEHSTWVTVGPFMAHIEGVTGKVDEIEARLAGLPDCVQINSKSISLQSGLPTLQQMLKNCQIPVRKDNYDVTQCSGASIKTQGLLEEPQNLTLHVP